LVACGDKSSDDREVDTADTAEDTDEKPQGTSCDEVRIEVNGEKAPAVAAVGDTWTVWLHCDDTLLAGVMVLSFDPVDFASIDSNEATFLMAGTGTMRLQVGSKWAEQEITVTK